MVHGEGGKAGVKLPSFVTSPGTSRDNDQHFQTKLLLAFIFSVMANDKYINFKCLGDIQTFIKQLRVGLDFSYYNNEVHIKEN